MDTEENWGRFAVWQNGDSAVRAAKELVEKRDAWLNPLGATEADLKERTLTNLYNSNPEWLMDCLRLT